MTPVEKQAALVAKFSILPDPQERLAAIVQRRPRLDPLREEERVDAHLVPGCVSRVWLVGEVAGGRLRVRVAADAHIVRGLAALLCEIYDGTLPDEAAVFETTILDALGISRMLTPTRAFGLGRVGARIRQLAAEG